MNERIKQLEAQSYTETMHELGGRYMAFDKEKFAKLIVQECAKRIALQAIHDEVTEAWVYDNLIVDIKEHFGVEE